MKELGSKVLEFDVSAGFEMAETVTVSWVTFTLFLNSHGPRLKGYLGGVEGTDL